MNPFRPRNILRKSLWLAFCFGALGGVEVHADDSGPFSPLTFNDGLRFTDPDKKADIHLRFRMQNRLDYETQSTQDLSPLALTPQVRRLRLRFAGWVLDPKWRYSLQLSFTRNDMDWEDSAFPGVVRDAAVIWKPSESFRLAFGQMKLPGNRQRVVSSGDLQLVDRSIVNRHLNLDRDFGVQSAIDAAVGSVPVRLRLALTSGDGRNSSRSTIWGLMGTARAEVLPFGEFTSDGDYTESDQAFEPKPKLSLGFGVAYAHNATRTRATTGAEISEPRSFGNAFADLLLKWNGFSLAVEYLNRLATNPTVGTETIFSGMGLSTQSGWMINPLWEVAFRHSILRAREGALAAFPAQNQWTLGVNHFLRGHRIKVQGDVTLDQAEQRADRWVGRLQFELGI